MTLLASTPAFEPALLGGHARAALVTDEPTVRAVFEEHSDFVLRMVRRFGVRPGDVEDVAQDVFLVVHRRLETFDRGRSMKAWLTGIVRRVTADYRKRAHVRREHPSEIPPAPTDGAPQERALARSQLRAILDAALDQLDEDKRAVFVLYELEGMTMAEVTESLDCPLQTGYSRLNAARRAVRAHVERALAEGSPR